MKNYKVVSNIPVRLPFTSTMLYTFLLYYFHVDNLWWGIFIATYSAYWIIAIIVVFKQETVDIFKEETVDGEKQKSFTDRLKDKLTEKK